MSKSEQSIQDIESVFTQLTKQQIITRKQSWFMNILVSFDQLGNTIAGGNPDSTISARIGRFKIHTFGRMRKYWRILECIVDYTFKPIDGDNHCYEAYKSDDEEVFNRGNIISKIILFIIVIISCIPLFIIIRIISLIYPKVKTKFLKDNEELTSDQVKHMRASYSQ